MIQHIPSFNPDLYIVHSLKKLVLPLLFLLLPILRTEAQVRLPSIFCSHMVLQQKATVPLWGWAEVDEQIRVTASWDQAEKKVSCSHTDGRWNLTLQTPAAGGPYTVTIRGNSGTIELTDVMIGEVWLCSGQSNMELKLPEALNGKEEIASGLYPAVRFFKVPKTASLSPQDYCFGNWVTCSRESMPDFSAVGYFFAKKLADSLHVTVGMINTNWGGSPIEAWIPAEKITSDTFLYERAMKNDPRWSPILPGSLWNAMVHPIDFYPIAGVIWYQGESNVSQYETYSRLMKMMIGSWRTAWKIDFPFYFVQIAPYTYQNNLSAFLREQQTLSQQISNTGMVVISDLVPDTTDIHPKAKEEVGSRLAMMALANHYGRKVGPVASPAFDHFENTPKGLRVYFNNCPSGLVVKGKEIPGFELAGSDKKYFPAAARLEKDGTVVVSSPLVKQPVSVRYCFKDAFVPALFSKNGLPVNSFRAGE